MANNFATLRNLCPIKNEDVWLRAVINYGIISRNKGVVSTYVRYCQHDGGILAVPEMTRLIYGIWISSVFFYFIIPGSN